MCKCFFSYVVQLFNQFNYWCSFFLAQETQKAKQFLPFLQRAGRSEALVEYVFSGSRLKLYMPKETCLITFLLAGKCQSASARQLRNHLWPHNDHNVASDHCCTTSLTLCFVQFFNTSRNSSPKKNENVVVIFLFPCHCSHSYIESGQCPGSVNLYYLWTRWKTGKLFTKNCIEILLTMVTFQCGKLKIEIENWKLFNRNLYFFIMNSWIYHEHL